MTDSPESDPAPPAPDAAASTARRVMVVDDSRVQRKILTTQLARAGYQVTEAASVEEALPLCAENAPDIVISDWVMPGLSGLDFCRALRAQKHESYTYFILLTSKTETAEVAHGLDGGADDFLTKPVTGDELRARIAAGDRIIRMERELTDNNRLLTEALTELRLINDSVNRDLVEARKLQQSLVRERFRKFGPVQVSLLLQPSGHIGGDLVGFFAIDAARVGVYALDVSGHGITSALMTARLAGYLSPSSPEQNIAIEELPGGSYRPLPPGQVVEHLNQLVLDEMETEHYFTLLLADVDLASGRVRMAQAGHPHPLVQRRDGTITQSGPGGLPVGLVPGASYDEFETVLAPGDRLMIFSDGIVECPSPSGDLLAEEGLETLVRDMREISGPALLETLLWKLSHFADDGDFPDDISAILLEYHGAPDDPPGP